jgi:hypothetical protein
MELNQTELYGAFRYVGEGEQRGRIYRVQESVSIDAGREVVVMASTLFNWVDDEALDQWSWQGTLDEFRNNFLLHSS